MRRWNVPGTRDYTPDLPLDIVLIAATEVVLRGYWLSRDPDGQVVFVSNQNSADQVRTDEDIDGVPVIVFDDELTRDFGFDGASTIIIKRYS